MRSTERNSTLFKIERMSTTSSANWILIFVIVVVFVLAAGWWWYVSSVNSTRSSLQASGASRSKHSKVSLSVANTLEKLQQSMNRFGTARSIAGVGALGDAASSVTSVTLPSPVPLQYANAVSGTSYLSWTVNPVTSGDSWTGIISFFKDANETTSAVEGTDFTVLNTTLLSQSLIQISNTTTPAYTGIQVLNNQTLYAQLSVTESGVTIQGITALQPVDSSAISTFSASVAQAVPSSTVDITVDASASTMNAIYMQVVDNNGNNLLNTSTSGTPNGVTLASGSPYTIATSGQFAYIDLSSSYSAGTSQTVSVTNITQNSYFVLTVVSATSQAQAFFEVQFPSATLQYSTINSQTAGAQPYPIMVVGNTSTITLSSATFAQASGTNAYVQVFDSNSTQLNKNQNSGNGALIDSSTPITTGGATVNVGAIILDNPPAPLQTVTIAILYTITEDNYTTLTNSTTVQLLGFPTISLPSSVAAYYGAILPNNTQPALGNVNPPGLLLSSGSGKFGSSNIPGLFAYLTSWTPPDISSVQPAALTLQSGFTLQLNYLFVAFGIGQQSALPSPRTYLVGGSRYDDFYVAGSSSSDTMLIIPSYFPGSVNDRSNLSLVPGYSILQSSTAVSSPEFLDSNNNIIGPNLLTFQGANNKLYIEWQSAPVSFIPSPVSANNAALSTSNVSLSAAAYNTSSGSNSIVLTINGFAGVCSLFLDIVAASGSGSTTSFDLTYTLLSKSTANSTTSATTIDVTSEITNWVSSNTGVSAATLTFNFGATIPDLSPASGSTTAVTLTSGTPVPVSFNLTIGSSPSVKLSVSPSPPPSS